MPCGIAESDHTRLHKERLVFHKVARGHLGSLHTGRFYIVSRHAAGNIECQDDRALLFGQRDHCLWAGQGNCQDGKSQEEKYHRNVTARARLAAFGPSRKTKAAVTVTGGQFPPARLHQEVCPDEQGN